MILEFEGLAFGASVLYYLMSIEKKITKLATVIEMCPNCPHKKGDLHTWQKEL